jgi:hypothetical protein
MRDILESSESKLTVSKNGVTGQVSSIDAATSAHQRMRYPEKGFGPFPKQRPSKS